MNEDEMVLAYRRVFNTADGKIVLEDIMDILQLNCTLESEQVVALHNAALIILDRMGIFRPWNNTAYINALLSLPYTPPPGDKE
jgi:hypothetical protein